MRDMCVTCGGLLCATCAWHVRGLLCAWPVRGLRVAWHVCGMRAALRDGECLVHGDLHPSPSPNPSPNPQPQPQP